MANPFQHINWAEQNEQFARSLDLSTNIGANWAITALFYAALHYVDAYLVSRGKREVDHERREWRIQNDPILSDIWLPYRSLKHLSREARYEMAPYGEIEFLKAKKRLEEVKTYILPKLHYRQVSMLARWDAGRSKAKSAGRL